METPNTGGLRLVPREPPFPRNVIVWRRWTGLRLAALVLLASNAVRIAETGYSATFRRERYRVAAQARVDNRGLLKRCWDGAAWYLWDRTPEPVRVTKTTEAIISTCRRRSLAGVALSWFLSGWSSTGTRPGTSSLTYSASEPACCIR